MTVDRITSGVLYNTFLALQYIWLIKLDLPKSSFVNSQDSSFTVVCELLQLNPKRGQQTTLSEEYIEIMTKYRTILVFYELLSSR